MNEEELVLLTSHSTVLGDQDIEELKGSEVIREFEGISLKAIFEGRETFQQFDKLIRILNLFFKYDLDLYPQLLSFLVNRYVLKCRNNAITFKGLINPVMMDVKEMIDNEGLYTYLFTGDTTNLRPEDIFRSKELLSVSTQHFEEKAFTSEVVSKGVSFITISDEMFGLFEQLENYPFVVSYEDLVKASIDEDNVILLDYLTTKHKAKQPINDIILRIEEETYKCINYASLNGHIECLKYFRENEGSSARDEETCSNAAFGGHLECLKYLHENKYPWNWWTCSEAARGGDLDCLKYLHENGASSIWEEDTCSEAAANGHLDCLKYAHENGCPWNEDTCSKAAFNGHLDCLKYVYESGGASLWSEWSCSEAARGGHLDCLKYAFENARSLIRDEWVCAEAALNGHLDCLKYAHENGFPWDKHACEYAERGGHEDCLKYVRDNGLSC